MAAATAVAGRFAAPSDLAQGDLAQGDLEGAR